MAATRKRVVCRGKSTTSRACTRFRSMSSSRWSSHSSRCSCTTTRPRRALTTASCALAAMIAQGTLGYVQYFNAIPELLVGFHVAGAVLVFGTVQWLVLELRGPRERRSCARAARSAGSGSRAPGRRAACASGRRRARVGSNGRIADSAVGDNASHTVFRVASTEKWHPARLPRRAAAVARSSPITTAKRSESTSSMIRKGQRSSSWVRGAGKVTPARTAVTKRRRGAALFAVGAAQQTAALAQPHPLRHREALGHPGSRRRAGRALNASAARSVTVRGAISERVVGRSGHHLKRL